MDWDFALLNGIFGIFLTMEGGERGIVRVFVNIVVADGAIWR